MSVARPTRIQCSPGCLLFYPIVVVAVAVFFVVAAVFFIVVAVVVVVVVAVVVVVFLCCCHCFSCLLLPAVLDSWLAGPPGSNAALAGLAVIIPY